MPYPKVWFHAQITILRLFICVAIGAYPLCLAKEPGITLILDPTNLSDWQTYAVWYAYLLKRVKFRKEHKLPSPKSGTVHPTFDEEVDARTLATQVYQKLKGENKGWRNAYCETLLEVKSEGFMNAYVWTYFHQESWPATVRPKNLAAFQLWDQLHLKNHRPMTYGALVMDKE